MSLHVIPGKAAFENDEERTSIDPGPPSRVDDAWSEEGTVVDSASSGPETATRNAQAATGGELGYSTGGGTGEVGHSTVDEPTVEDQARPLPPLSLVPPLPRPARVPGAKLVVVTGNDSGREFSLDTARTMTVGRAIDNDVVLTDIAVSRRHLDLAFDGEYWVLRDHGSGNGTLVNERIEDGSCRLYHDDRIEIGNTIFRFEHTASAPPPAQLGWGQDEDEASTVAARRKSTQPPGRDEPNGIETVPVRKERIEALERGRKATLPPPVPRSKSTSQSPEQRLVLPPVPPGASAVPDDGAPALLSGPVTAAEALSSSGPMLVPQRHLTSTARVEPRPYGAAALPYPFVVRPPSKKRPAMIAGVVATGVVLVGIIAKLTAGPAPATGPIAATAARPAAGGATMPAELARDVEPAPAPVPAPIQAPAVHVAVPAVAPTPAPTPAPIQAPAVHVAVPAPEPSPAPAPPAPPPPAHVAVAPPTPPPPAPVAVATPAHTPTPAVHVAPPPRTVPHVVTTPHERTRPAVVHTAPRHVATTHATRSAPEVSSRSPIKAVGAARKKAAAEYGAGKYEAAAQTLRGATDGADPSDAAHLRTLAADYETVGQALSAGASATSPITAYNAYTRALLADRRTGGAQGAAIRSKLGNTAPQAAASYMAQNNYEAAKRAADAAADFGNGASPMVQHVRQSLERKAEQFYTTAQKIMSQSPDDAKNLLRRILKITAPDSPTYQKAYQALNARSRHRDDDE